MFQLLLGTEVNGHQRPKWSRKTTSQSTGTHPTCNCCVPSMRQRHCRCSAINRTEVAFRWGLNSRYVISLTMRAFANGSKTIKRCLTPGLKM